MFENLTNDFIFKFCSEFEKMFLFQNLFSNSKNIRVSKFLLRVSKSVPFNKNLFTYSKMFVIFKKCSVYQTVFTYSENVRDFYVFHVKFEKCSLLEKKHFFQNNVRRWEFDKMFGPTLPIALRGIVNQQS